MAPHELVETTLILPNPGLNDAMNMDLKVSYEQAIDGTIYSYVQKSNRFIFEHSYLIPKAKVEELRRFFKAYSVSNIRLYNYDDTIWVVNFQNKELNATTQFAGGIQLVTVEYVGKQVT